MNRTILIAEDNPDLLEVLSLQFDWRGYRVLRARDGAEALALLEHKPDLLVLDVVMPRKSGYEVCRSLKSDPARRRLPVILLSGRRGETDREWGLECGADAYLTKPFGIRELEAQVGRLLASRECPQPGESSPPPARGAAPGGVMVRWSLDPEAARVFRQKYGELAWRRLLRDLPLHLLRRLSSWGVEGCALRDDYGAVSLALPVPRRRVEACLERLTTLGNDFLRSFYDAEDTARGAVLLARSGAGEDAERAPLLRLSPRLEGEAGVDA